MCFSFCWKVPDMIVAVAYTNSIPIYCFVVKAYVVQFSVNIISYSLALLILFLVTSINSLSY